MFETICCNCMRDTKGIDPCPHCHAPLDFENEAPALQLRTILNDQYLVGKCLGKGGFGITYLGLDTRLQMLVAIKEFFPKRLASRGTNQTQVIPNTKDYVEHYEYGLTNFLEEAQMLAHFNHPTIVPILFFFRENNTAYFVMRYIQGKTLENYVKEQRKISEKDLLKIMLQILDGLQVVHNANTLHRDIKPQNIYLSEEGFPLLLDFGAARQAMQDDNHTLSVFFTPGYAPIEQYPSGKHPGKGNMRQGPWTDVYACAATMYSCLRAEFRDHHLEPPPEPTERLLKGDSLRSIHQESKVKLSNHVAQAIMRGLEIQSERRPQTIAEFQRLLTQPLPSSPFRPEPRPRPPSSFELLIVAGEFEGQRIPLSSTPIVIGKDPGKCALVFSDRAISRTHCQISIVNGSVYVKDLYSSNGTWINDERKQEAWLKADDMVSLAGRVVLQVVANQQAWPLNLFNKEQSSGNGRSSNNFVVMLKKFGAFLLDGAGIIIISLIISMLLGKFSEQAGKPMVFSFVLTAIAWTYGTLMEQSAWQTTFGKLVFGMIVTDKEGYRLSSAKAAKRNLSRMIPLLIFDAILLIGDVKDDTVLIGTLIMFCLSAFLEVIETSSQQGFCDRTAESMVVVKWSR